MIDGKNKLFFKFMNSFIEALKRRLQEELPGEEAHIRMLPDSRRKGKQHLSPKKAGVLILLFPDNQNVKTLVIKRAIDNSPHSGQIALPGGRHEENDIDITFTALRETYEEIGVLPDEIEILGSLTSIYIPVSNYEVFPAVGIIEEKPLFNLNNREVESVIEIALEELTGDDVFQTFYFRQEENKEIEAPCLQIKNSPPIWGATAMILSELIDILNDIMPIRWR